MATITEDYVSFETAKLLKEKGFEGKCHMFDNTTTKTFGERWNVESTIDTPIPTLQMAMKWLREVHNLCIEPYRTASGYLYTISKIWTGSEIYSDEFNGDDEDSGQWTTYEKACEAAIKYCLEHLI